MEEGISEDEEKESEPEQLTELESTDNPETQSQEKLDLQAKFSALAQFGYKAAKIPVFPPAPTPQGAIGPKPDVSQVENNYQEKPQELQSDEGEKENEQISTEGEKIHFSGGVSGDEDNRKLIQTQLVAGESLAENQNERWENIDIPGAIAYNKGLNYSIETILVIRDTLILQKFLPVNTEHYLEGFNEETVIAIAKWQEAKGLAEVDGKIGYGTRESLGITQRLFDDKEGYGYDYFKGQPFVQGGKDPDEIDPNDVAQGNLGNCYFAAGMMAVALANPSLIRELIKDNGDGSYNVTLYPEEGKKVEIKVTPYFPTVAPGVPAYARKGDEQELWPMLLEKAYAQYKEGYGETGKGEGGYDLIGQGGHPGDVVKLLTGSLPQEFKEKYPNIEIKDVYSVQEENWFDVARSIASSLGEHCAVTAGTIDPPDGEEKSTKKGKKKAGENGIYFNHSYVIKSIYKKGEGKSTPDNILLDLLNPWGKEHINGLSMSWFMKYFDTLYINPVSQRYVAPKTPVSQPDPEQLSSNQSKTDSLLSEEDRSILQGVLSQLQEFSKPVAEFVAGAIFQYIYDNGGIARWVLQIFPEWRQLEEGVEQELPNSFAFNLGRVAGDGAAIITGIAEIIGGGGTAAGGGTVCLLTAGGGCIVGAPAIAVGLAVAGHGGSTALEGARNIIKHLGVVFHSTTGNNDEDIWAELDELNNPTVENVARTPDGWILSTHAELDSLARHNVTLEKVDDIIRNATRKTTQSNGATVFIEIIGSKRSPLFNIAIVNEEKQTIVTALKELDKPSLNGLAKNQEWNSNQAMWTIIEK